MVRKRERENPCFICGHYHKYEEGEVCGICGHRLQEAGERNPLNGSGNGSSSSSISLASSTSPSSSTYHHTPSAFSSEILPLFLYLGSYDNASRAELLKAQGISRILNVSPVIFLSPFNPFVHFGFRSVGSSSHIIFLVRYLIVCDGQ